MASIMDTTSSFVFKDYDFQKNKWRKKLFCGPKSSRFIVDHIPCGGREGAFRQHIQQWNESIGNEKVVVKHINLQSVFHPSESGAIRSIDFDCSLINIEHSTETHFALLIEQNNTSFVSRCSVSANKGNWTTFSLNNLKSTDFQRLIEQDEEELLYLEDHPNFTFVGAPMHFGYITTCTTSRTAGEAVSGLDFWRVTIDHENAESAHQSMRLMQLEHNNNVLIQELSDMHEHADITRREHVSHVASMHTIQDEVSQERVVSAQLRRDLAQERNSTASAHEVIERLENRVSEMREEATKLEEAFDLVKHESENMKELERLLSNERKRCAGLNQCIRDMDEALTKANSAYEDKSAEMVRFNLESAAANDALKTTKQTIASLTEKIKILQFEQDKTSKLNITAQQALTESRVNSERLEKLLETEKSRRIAQDQEHAAACAEHQDDLRSLRAQMEADLTRQRALGLQEEREHRDELNRIESAARKERIRMEERCCAERALFTEKEAQLLEEKRNLATSLQAATTKSALTEQRLSSQLLSASASHKSEVERIALLEAELQQERKTREILEQREEEDWEVVADV